MGLSLAFDEISKIAASLPAMIYVDSKMTAIALAKISGYNNPHGIQDGSWQFDLVCIYGILAFAIQINTSIDLHYGFTKANSSLIFRWWINVCFSGFWTQCACWLFTLRAERLFLWCCDQPFLLFVNPDKLKNCSVNCDWNVNYQNPWLCTCPLKINWRK